MIIRQYVQSGVRKTVQQVIQRFDDGTLVKGNFGRMVAHARNWEIPGFVPDPSDAAEVIGKESERPASVRIGDAIVRGYLHSLIEVPRPWPWEERSEFLKPVKGGICTGCGEQVTVEMQHDLKKSKEVVCKGCGAWLFGPGE